MLLRSSILGCVIVIGVSVTRAIPQLSTVTITVKECPLGRCTKICATPTVTTDPTAPCAFNTNGCPVARCIYPPPITSISTRYCKGACTSLTTTSCESIPTVTAIPPCPTGCPDLCPIPIETVAVACPTSLTRVKPTIIIPTLALPTA